MPSCPHRHAPTHRPQVTLRLDDAGLRTKSIPKQHLANHPPAAIGKIILPVHRVAPRPANRHVVVVALHRQHPGPRQELPGPAIYQAPGNNQPVQARAKTYRLQHPIQHLVTTTNNLLNYGPQTRRQELPQATPRTPIKAQNKPPKYSASHPLNKRPCCQSQDTATSQNQAGRSSSQHTAPSKPAIRHGPASQSSREREREREHQDPANATSDRRSKASASSCRPSPASSPPDGPAAGARATKSTRPKKLPSTRASASANRLSRPPPRRQTQARTKAASRQSTSSERPTAPRVESNRAESSSSQQLGCRTPSTTESRPAPAASSAGAQDHSRLGRVELSAAPKAAPGERVSIFEVMAEIMPSRRPGRAGGSGSGSGADQAAAAS